MKKLTYDEFQNRMTEISNARKIFIPHITNNISIAFSIYNELLAEEKMATFLSTRESWKLQKKPIDDYNKPRCPECYSLMNLRVNVVDKDGKTWNSSWTCSNCFIELYSDKTADDWLKEIVNEEDQKND